MMCVSIHVLLDHGLCRNLPFGLQVICFRVIGFASFFVFALLDLPLCGSVYYSICRPRSRAGFFPVPFVVGSI